MKQLLTLAALLCAACTAYKTPEKTRTAVAMSDRIMLVQPDTVGGLTINEALQNRRSWRDYGSEALSLEELSSVMWAAAGINRPANDHLTAPSAMGLYPIGVYAFFAEGVYRYDAKANQLVRVLKGDLRRMSGMQDFVDGAPLNLVYVADRSVYDGKSIPADHIRYLCGQDAAGYAENVNLYTAGHSLRSITRGSASPDLIPALGLDTTRYFFALAQTVGK